MKKLILSIGLSILLFIVYAGFPKSSSATPKIDCWQTYMNDEYSLCTKQSTKCILECPSNPSSPSCLSGCTETSKLCADRVKSLYSACVEAQKQPTPAPTPSSSTEYIHKCWSTYMVDEMATCSPPQDKCISKCAQLSSGFNACSAECSVTFNACLDHASADYRACDEAGRQAAQVKQLKKPSKASSQSPAPPTKMPFFIGEWLRAASGAIFLNNWLTDTMAIMMTGHDTQEIAKTEKAVQYIESLTDEYVDFVTGYAKDELEERIAREPELSDDLVKRLRGETQDSPFRLDILEGQAQIKYPGQQTWVTLKAGDKIPQGSTIFTGVDTTTILSIKDRGAIEVLPFSEVTVSEQGLQQAGKEGKTSTDVHLQKGEIEVNVEPSNLSPGSGVPGWGMSVYGPYYSAAIRGTHFWVKQEEGKQLATIGVYKGQVEVKANGSQNPILISPKGNKPGVIVIAQKLSVIKLALLGLLLLVVMGGVFWLLKRRKKA